MNTLGHYLDLCSTLFGKDAPSTSFFQKKIDQHHNGRDEPVITPESQILFLIGTLEKKNHDPDPHTENLGS